MDSDDKYNDDDDDNDNNNGNDNENDNNKSNDNSDAPIYIPGLPYIPKLAHGSHWQI